MRPKSSIPPAYKRDRGDHPSTFHMGFYLGIYPSSWSVLGPVYKYLDILENGEFSPFSKKIRAAHTKRIGITFSLSLRSTAVLVGCVNKPIKVGKGSEIAKRSGVAACSRPLLVLGRSVMHPTKPPRYAG